LGTYNNITGAQSAEDCAPCDPGQYCAGTMLPRPTGPCDAGYYCSGGATTPTQKEAPPGTYTKSGASAPVPCAVGTYNPEHVQEACLPCTQGYFCGNTSTVTPTACPKGRYCPQGSDAPLRCPRGTFSSVERLHNVTQCEDCGPGKHCNTNGLTAEAGDCDAGFFCTGRSEQPNPVGKPYGDECPAGSFCPQGSGDPVPCPSGRYSASVRATSAEGFCQPCPATMHCNGTGLVQAAGFCAAGFHCSGGAQGPRPVNGVGGGVCPSGHYCPPKSATPIKCAAGTFANETGAHVCKPCPQGAHCDGVRTG